MDPVESHPVPPGEPSPLQDTTIGKKPRWEFQRYIDFGQASKPKGTTEAPCENNSPKNLLQRELFSPPVSDESHPKPIEKEEPSAPIIPPPTLPVLPPAPAREGTYITIPGAPRAQGTLFERSTLREIPGDLATFSRDIGPNVFNWAKPALRYHEGQVEAVMYSIQNPGNILLSAPTNSGKTVVMLYLAARALAEQKQVVILAPTKVLCDQIADRAREFLALREEEVVCLSGAKEEYERNDREALYKDPSKRLLITTAESFVVNAPTIDCRRFGLALIDEVHMMRGNHALVTAVQHLSDDGVRVVGVTASAGEDVAEEEMLRKQLNANLHYMRTEAHNVTSHTEIFRASDFHDEYTRQSFVWAAGLLEGTVRERAVSAIYWAIRGEHVDLAALITSTYFPSVSFRPEFERIRARTGDVEVRAEAFRSLLEEASVRMPFPLRGEEEEGADEKSPLGAIEGVLSRILNEEHQTSSRLSMESKALVGAVYGAAHIPNLYEKLRASGIVSFLNGVAERLIEVRHGVQPRIGAKKRERIPGYLSQFYGAAGEEEFGVLKAYRALVGDRLVDGDFGGRERVSGPRLFTALADAKSFAALLEIFPTEEGEVIDTPKKKTKYLRRFLHAATSEVAQMGWAWRNSPKEERMIQNIQSYFAARGGEGSLLVYSNDTAHARYLSEMLTKRFAQKDIRATYIVGSSRLKKSAVHENLTGFREGKFQILVMTDVGKLGLDISSVERLEIYGSPWLGRDLIQLRGRVRHNGAVVPVLLLPGGREMSLAHVNTYVVSGTLDQFRDRKSSAGLERYFARVNRALPERGEEVPF